MRRPPDRVAVQAADDIIPKELRHLARRPDRVPCWRPVCRASFGPYATIERRGPHDELVVARCHRAWYWADSTEFRAEIWRYVAGRATP